MSIVVNPIADLLIANSQPTVLNLSNHFDDPRTTGLVARFELYNTSLGGGITNVLLFDQPGAGAPLTVQNFLRYVNDGDYINTIIHRSVPTFIVQGGGFTVDGLAQNITNPAAAVRTVPADPPVQNEFSSGRSNLRGTIAMAKLAGNPNSATSQWFFNLANNSANLDNQNGGFTVFGQALSALDLAPLDAIATLSQFNDADEFFGQPAFSDIPLIVNPVPPLVTGDENVVRYRNITISQLNELQFSIVGNTNPALVNASILNNQLVLNYGFAPIRSAAITIQATNLLGQTAQDTLLVILPTIGADTLIGTTGNDVMDGQKGGDRISGLEGDDWLLGQQGADTLIGGAGNDRLQGSRGNDTLNGGDGNDLVQGGTGNDALNGGRGSDRLNGGLGLNTITTGRGRDTIILNPKDSLSTDVVTDFTDQLDNIQLVGGLSFGQLNIRQQAANTLVQFGGHTLLVLQNFNAAALNQADFIA